MKLALMLALASCAGPPPGADMAAHGCWYAAAALGKRGADVRCVERVERLTEGR